MSDAIGSIHLDLDIRGDLDRQINSMTSGITNRFKNLFGKSSKTAFSGVESTVKKSMGNISETIDKTLGSRSIKVPEVNTESVTSKMETVEKLMDNVESKISLHNQKLVELKRRYEDSFSPKVKDKVSEKILNEEGAIIRLQAQMDSLNDKYGKYESQLNSASQVTEEKTEKTNKLGNSYDRVSRSLKNLNSHMPNFNKHVKQSGRNASVASSSMSRFMRTLIVSRILMSTVTRAVMAMGSSLLTSLKTNDQFARSLLQIQTNLKVAFMPIYQYILPAINALMSAIAKLTAYLASFLSMLFGKTYSQSLQAAKGLDAAKQSMDGAGSSAGSAAGELKELQRQLMGFDEVNKIEINTDTDSGGGGGFDFVSPDLDMSAVDSQMGAWAERAKEIFSRIFQPFKEAWAAEGANTIASMKFALGSIWDLVKAIGSDFLDIWTNGTGTKMLSTIYKIIQNIFNLVGNLGVSFKNAWQENEVGKRIIQGVFDLLQSVLDTIHRITKSTAEWAKTIDFSPLLESLSRMIEALKPVLDAIGNTLANIWEKSVLPFISWLIESALPTIIDGIGSIFEFLGNNQEIVEAITLAVVAFFAAFKVASIITSVIGMLQGFSAALGAIFTPATLIVAAIGALIAIGVLLYQNWDTVISSIKDIFQSFSDFMSNAFVTDWSENFGVIGAVFNGFFTLVQGIWEGVKQVFTGFVDFFAGIFTGNLSRAFSGLISIIKGIFDGLTSVVKAPINAVIGILNSFIRGLNRIKVPDWVPAVGGKGINIPTIPLLAKGGIIDQPTLSVVGEAGKEAVMPLEHNTGWIDQLAADINKRGGSGGGLTKQDLKEVIDSAMDRLIDGMRGMGFYIDGELLAKAVMGAMENLNGRYNTVSFY